MTDKEDPTVGTAGEEKTVKEVPAQKPPVAEKKAASDATQKPAPAEKTAPAKAPAAAKSAAAKPAAKTAAASVESKSEPESFKMRRRLIWTSVAAFLGTITLAFVRFFLPRTLFEPSTVFRIGYPSEFGIGVETKFQNQYRIWVVRSAEKLFVIYARCTHLGCTPDWVASENKFKCPCHGSGYDIEGINFEGPAPRPMDRAKVTLDAEGQIVVDTSKLYVWPKGARSEFKDDGSFIQV
jgi:cytochrome b6-f complex iron-sulfur subunit